MNYYWKGTGSYNEASYYALIAAVEAIPKGIELSILTDSRLVINQMKGIWSVKFAHLARLHEKAKKIIEEKGIKVSFSWISREKNAASVELSVRNGTKKRECPMCNGSGHLSE